MHVQFNFGMQLRLEQGSFCRYIEVGRSLLWFPLRKPDKPKDGVVRGWRYIEVLLHFHFVLN